MTPDCSQCPPETADRTKIVRKGFYYRTSDAKFIQRFVCRSCGTGFSHATGHPCFGQKKRHKNEMVRRLLCSTVSQRRAAKTLRLSRHTIVKKFLFLAAQAQSQWRAANLETPQATVVEFDDLETIEHTKCKPLSVTLAVESPTRRILGLQVSSMPANGPLARKAREKYGHRKDERMRGRSSLFTEIAPLVAQGALLKSDENPHYPSAVRKHFPHSEHKRFKGRRGAITGQGELKKIGFDPLFSLNHTFAKMRADINRLLRRTWCTTKLASRLEAHLHLYAQYHNENLPKPRPLPPSSGAG